MRDALTKHHQRFFMLTRRSLIVSSIIGASLLARAYAEEKYPQGPVRLVVGFAPGGGNDILARILAEKLQQSFGQPFIVENRPGANGIVAIENVRRAEPNGLTLLVGPSSGMTVNPVILKSVSYDPVKDFEPISITGYFPLIIVVHPAVPVNSVAELIALAKAKPGDLTYSSAASSFQLATEMFAQMAKISLRCVPYRGSAPAINAVVANEVALNFGDIAAVLPFVRSKMVRALAVTTASRLESLPEIPTVAESGLPQFDISLWSGLFAPAGTPPNIIAVLEKEVRRIVDLSDVKQRMRNLGIEPAGTSASEVTSTIKSELERFKQIAATAGITAEP